MYLDMIRRWREPWDECTVLDRMTVMGDCTVAAAALTRKGKKVKLWLLQYDDTFLERREVMEFRALSDQTPSPTTNREELRVRGRYDGWDTERLAFGHPKALILGGREYPIEESGMRRAVEHDWSCIFTLEALMRAGWEPGELAFHDTDAILLTDCTLPGEFDAIPPCAGPIRLIPQPEYDSELTECDLSLPLKEDFSPVPLSLENGRLIYFTGAELMDPWAHLEKTFSDPKVQSIPLRQREESRKRSEKIYEEYCPRGMAFPVVYFEAEEDVSPQCYLTEWLDAPIPHGKDGCLGISARPDTVKVGPRGLTIRCMGLSDLPIPLDDPGPLSIGAVVASFRREKPEVTL